MSRLAQIEKALAAAQRSIEKPKGRARGAVSLILKARPAVEILLIERAEREDDPWSGQIAFPGGRRARGDRNDLATAKRETKEEVGFSLNRNARVLGALTPRAPGNRTEWLVVPYVFGIARPPKITPGGEVARAFWAPLDALPATLHKAVIEFPMGELETPAFEVEGKPLWGFSFRVLLDLFDIVGWPKEEPKAASASKRRWG